MEESELLEQVANSALFRKAPSSRELLLYLWKQRDTALSEYAIGVDVLGRKPDFDPKTDATVRVQVSRLRLRLKEYYANEGLAAQRRFSIPAGAYRLECSEPLPVAPSSPLARPARRWLLPALATGLAIAVADNVRLRWRGTPTLHPFLVRLFRPGHPVQLIVPVPLFFRWPTQSLVARDFRVNTAGQLTDSPHLNKLVAELGSPETTQLYTVASDTLAAAALSRHLEERGVPNTVIDSPAATVELLSSRDTAVFVGPGTSAQFADLIAGANFYLRPGTGQLINRQPQPGEPVSFATTSHSPVHVTSHAALARLPGRTPDTQLLLFSSSFNPALITLLTSPSQMDAIERLHQQNGAPPYFEIVIQYERNGDRLLRLQPMLFRTVPPTR